MADPTRIDTAWTRLLAAVGVAALAFALLPPAMADAQEDGQSVPEHLQSQPRDASVAQADSQIDIQRFEGATRYQTAAEIATAEFDASDNVVIASGEDFPDALAGSALEGSLDAPVLLVPENLIEGSIPGEITDAIDELGATSATFLGGTDAVSSDVEDYIVDNSSVSDTDRVSGATRYETAAAIADEVDAINGNAGQLNGESLAFVATGEDFPDALAAGPAAFDGQHPVLLTPGDELHDAADAALADFDPDTVVVLGGSDAVNPAVEDNLENQNYDVARIGGGNRFETATLLADFFIDDFGFDVDDVGLATGSPFADALASAPHMGTLNGPLLLTPFNTTEDNTLEFFETHGCDIERLHVFGGEEAINENVAHEYAEAACPDEDEQGTIFGQVTETATAAPIQDAEITVSNGETETVTVGANGEFEQVVDAPETYTVTADAPGYEPETEEDLFVDVDEDEEVNFTLQPADGSIAGTVTNIGGDTPTPVEDATVTVVDSDMETVAVETTTAQGTYSADELPTPETYTVTADADGKVPEEQTVELGPGENRDDVDFGLPPTEPANLQLAPQQATNVFGDTHEVTATVTDDQDAPVDDTDVRFEVYRDATGNDIYALADVAAATAGADGQAAFAYNNDEETGGDRGQDDDIIVACVDDADDSVSEPVCADATPDNGNFTDITAAADGIADDAEKTWVEGGTVEGTVADVSDAQAGNVDDEGAVPIEDATVTAEQDGEEVATTETDANGEYELALVEGTYEVTADADGYEATTEDDVDVTDGAATDVDFGLYPEADVPDDGTVQTTSDSDDVTVTGDGEWWVVDLLIPDNGGEQAFSAQNADTIVWERPDDTAIELGAAGTDGAWLNRDGDADDGTSNYDQGTYSLYYEDDGTWYQLDVTFDADGTLIEVNGDAYSE